ncbi:MAG: EamA family transporter [Flavihumibacter sp.]|nr:EamA family transporter [Flavihumibacter sp.]
MPVKVILAFAAVYLIWGSTYLAAQFGLATIPPYLMGSMRFAIAGFLLLAWSFISKKPMPGKRAIVVNSVGGILMLVGGSGSVLWSQQYLGSGLAAILVASLPIWFVILDRKQWSFYFGDKRVIMGVILGFIGILLLFGAGVSNGLQAEKGWMQVIGIGVILLGCIAWTIGSLYVKYKAVQIDVATSAGIQLFSAGLFSLIPSFLSGEWNGFEWSQVSTGGWLSLLYLTIPGSLIAFMSYIYLLAVRPAAQAGTYAYVNPVIAVLLGVLFAHEKVSGWQVIGLITILLSVLMINWSNYKK